MQFEYHLFQCLGGDWDDDNAEVVEFRLRDGETENIHLLVDELGIFAGSTGEFGLHPASEEIVYYCRLLRYFLTELVQQKVQELLSIVLLETTEYGHVGVD